LGHPGYNLFAQTAGECHWVGGVFGQHDVKQIDAQRRVLLCGAQESVEVGHRVDDHDCGLLNLAGIAADRVAMPVEHVDLWAASSTVWKPPFHESAYCATRRNVLRSPVPAVPTAGDTTASWPA
jgi:hypothetical protein